LFHRSSRVIGLAAFIIAVWNLMAGSSVYVRLLRPEICGNRNRRWAIGAIGKIAAQYDDFASLNDAKAGHQP
jgi:hypothetical protein